MQGLSIKAAAKLSGLTSHTLRAWERRYSVVEPIRAENGRRLYSLADVEKLKLLALLTANGHAISQLAKMSLSELERLALEKPRPADEHRVRAAPPPSFTDGTESESLKALLEALRAFDLEEIDRQILKARINSPARSFIIDLVGPLLHQVGQLVEQNRLDIAQEHALSAVLRNHLGELLAQVQKASDWASEQGNHRPRLLFSTPEGDLHEFGILLAAILAGSHGFKFRYLGPNMPAESLANAARAMDTRIVVIGSVHADAERLAQPLKEYVSELSRELFKGGRADIAIWIGGHCDFEIEPSAFACPIHHAGSFADFENQLEKFKTRFPETAT